MSNCVVCGSEYWTKGEYKMGMGLLKLPKRRVNCKTCCQICSKLRINRIKKEYSKKRANKNKANEIKKRYGRILDVLKSNQGIGTKEIRKKARVNNIQHYLSRLLASRKIKRHWNESKDHYEYSIKALRSKP